MRNNIGDNIEHWINNTYAITGEQLSIFRIIFASYILLFGLRDYNWLSTVPEYFYSPTPYNISYLFFSIGYPNLVFTIGLGLALVILYLLLLFGWKTRIVSVLATVITIIGNSFAYSFGKIDHFILLDILPLVFSFSQWGSAYSLDALLNKEKKTEQDELQHWQITLMALLLGFAMFTAGVPKLLGGWLDLSTNAVRGHLFYHYYVNERHDFLATYFINIHNGFFWELMDWAGTLFELGFLLAIINRTLFRFWLSVAVIFHIVNYLMLNISFSGYMIIYLIFIDWNIFNLYRLESFFKRFSERYFTPVNVCAAIGVSIVFYFTSGFIPSHPEYSVSLLWFVKGTYIELFKYSVAFGVVVYSWYCLLMANGPVNRGERKVR